MLFYTLFALCCFMSGVIWIIQLVHYPSFIYIPEQDFAKFEKFHASSITKIVMPVMLAELGVSILVYYNNSSNLLLANLVLNIFLFLSTFFLSVPIHARLAQRKNPKDIKKLVLTNWPRTILWSIRLIILYSFLISR